MAQLTTLLLYEIQKKYPEAVIKDGGDSIVIIYQGKAAVTLGCSFGSYSDGTTLYSHSRVSFDYYGKERSRDNNVYLRDLIEPQDVEIPQKEGLPKKVYGIVITPNRVSTIAKACLKKIALLFKVAKERIDVHVRMAEQAKIRGSQLFNDVKAAVGDRVDVKRDGSSVTISYRGTTKTLYSTDARRVSVSVPLNKLADVLDLLAEPQAAVA